MFDFALPGTVAPVSSTYTVAEFAFANGTSRHIIKLNGTSEADVALKAEALTKLLQSPDWIAAMRGINQNPAQLAALYAGLCRTCTTEIPPADKVRSNLTYVTSLTPISCFIVDRRKAVTEAFSNPSGNRKSSPLPVASRDTTPLTAEDLKFL